MSYTRISLLLCVFGFFKEFRPSDPFSVEYFTGQWMNFTKEQVYQEIFPVGTYSYLTTSFAVLLLTDYLRYKPVIILCGIAGSSSAIITIWGRTIQDMKFHEVFFGLFQSTEIAYLTYIYTKISKLHYQKVTSHTRIALSLGRFTASVVAQLIVSFNLLDYHQLLYLTLAGLVLATIWAFFLPPVSQSIYFHRSKTSECAEECLQSQQTIQIKAERCIDESSQTQLKIQTVKESDANRGTFGKIKNVYRSMWRDFLLAYSNPDQLKWSVWWAFATCGYFQVCNYIQFLWKNSMEESDNVYNGLAEAVLTVIVALSMFGIGKLNLNWSVVGEAVLSVFALIQGAALIVASQTQNIWCSYISYITFVALYQAMITVVSSEVAKNLSDESYGFIFGINMLVALLLQSLLAFAVTGNCVFALSIRLQCSWQWQYV
ncbi:thiamine transporter 2-like isoform X2 [Athalia rosae]|uniref:thiamine transporter 2-like isoform X2 n=1 Tax=Athalia rosae TaxID=37344 RepID=UPI002033BD6E|nr:thiamine transporter 2-like isoform X2 [Athalia rosae]